MKSIILIFLFLLTSITYSQIDCEYNTNVIDSIGTYKATKDYIVSEKIFGGHSDFVFFSLVKTDDLPSLNVQFITKSMDFIKANCFDKNSKIYFQLNNGKIITMLHINSESCGTMVKDDKGFNNRILTGYFLFIKDSFQDLKSFPISFMRIKYATETVDYVLKSDLQSEMDFKTYNPDTYFINYLKCID